MEAAAFEQVYGAFGDFHATSLRCLAAGRRGTTAVITSRPCWCSRRTGATPRISPNQWESRPGPCSASSPKPPGMTTR